MSGCTPSEGIQIILMGSTEYHLIQMDSAEIRTSFTGSCDVSLTVWNNYKKSQLFLAECQHTTLYSELTLAGRPVLRQVRPAGRRSSLATPGPGHWRLP
jgi:hypothetical protein